MKKHYCVLLYRVRIRIRIRTRSLQEIDAWLKKTTRAVSSRVQAFATSFAELRTCCIDWRVCPFVSQIGVTSSLKQKPQNELKSKPA